LTPISDDFRHVEILIVGVRIGSHYQWASRSRSCAAGASSALGRAVPGLGAANTRCSDSGHGSGLRHGLGHYPAGAGIRIQAHWVCGSTSVSRPSWSRLSPCSRKSRQADCRSIATTSQLYQPEPRVVRDPRRTGHMAPIRALRPPSPIRYRGTHQYR
jgi:hypothetical protein